jgi:hypothetical protein
MAEKKMANKQLVDAYFKSNSFKESTEAEYKKHFKFLIDKIDFDGDEEKLINYFENVKNPNTRSNKIFPILQLRKFHSLPYEKLEQYRTQLKNEIRIHRLKKLKEDKEKLMTYTELLNELDKLHGIPFIVNYMWIFHALRNADLNAIVKHNEPTDDDNVIVYDPDAETDNKQVMFYIRNYKTADTYGEKKIVVDNNRFYNELASLKRKDGEPLFIVKYGQRAKAGSVNTYINKMAIGNLNETKITKIVMKHWIDNKDFARIGQMSQDRGTALSTLYSSYNLYDREIKHDLIKKELNIRFK